METADWRDALKSLIPDDYQPQEKVEPQDDKKAEKRPVLRIDLDKKRAGKTATIISGFDADDPRCGEVANSLKRRLATGGSSRGGEILIQGDRTNDCVKILKELGYKIANANRI